MRTADRTIDLGQYEIRRDISPGLHLSLLGGFRLSADGLLVPLPMSAQRLIAFLALHDDPVTRVYVAGSLWPDASERRAFGSLRSTLWRIGRIERRLIDAASLHLRLTERVMIDARELELYARRVRSGAGGITDSELDAAPLWGDLLPDWYDEWVVDERERLRQIRVHMLEILCRQLTADHRFDRAVEIGLAAVAADPLRESAHRELIRTHLAEGNRSEAIRQYGAYRGVFESELGFALPRDIDSFLRV